MISFIDVVKILDIWFYITSIIIYFSFLPRMKNKTCISYSLMNKLTRQK
jgi:hypothetical protein